MRSGRESTTSDRVASFGTPQGAGVPGHSPSDHTSSYFGLRRGQDGSERAPRKEGEPYARSPEALIACERR